MEKRFKKNRYNGVLLIGISLLSPLLGLFLAIILIIYDTVEWKSCVFSISLFMAVIAYNYNPTGTTDLFRYFQMIDNVKGYDFATIMTSTYSSSSPMYTFNFMRWICVVTEDSHLLPAISVFFVYLINLFIVYYIGRQRKKHIETVLYIAVVLCCFDWWGLANNIRNLLSFSIVCFAVFREIECKKKNIYTYVLYPIAVFLHPTAIILIVLRFALVIKNNVRYAVIIIAVLIPQIINFAYNTLYSILPSEVLRRILYMAYKYFNDTSSAWGVEVQASVTHRLLKILVMCCMAICVYAYISSTNNKRKKSSQTAQYAFYLSISTIACFPIITPAYWRFSYPSISMNCINYFDLKDKKKKSILDEILPIMMLVLSVLIMLIYIWRNRNPSYDILKSFSLLTSCPIVTIIRDVGHAVL